MFLTLKILPGISGFMKPNLFLSLGETEGMLEMGRVSG